MKKSIAMIVCVAAGLAGARAGAQETFRDSAPPPPVAAAPPPPVAAAPPPTRPATAADRAAQLAADAADQERANAALRDQLRRVGGAPGSIEVDLVNASADAAALRRKVAEQQVRRDAARDKLDAARREALARLDDGEGVSAARRALDEAGAKLDEVSGPILERLAENEDYQELQALVDAAAQSGQALQGFDNVDPRTQAEADAAFDQATERARAFEEAAIAADPRGAQAQRAFKDARAAIDGVRAENQRKVATDIKVDGGRFALDLEQRLLDDKLADLASAEKRLSAMRQAAGARPDAVANPELANQLRDGEAKLRDLNDRLDQARAARADEERARFADSGDRGDLDPRPGDDDGRFAEPPPAYTYREYTTYSYVPATTYYRYRTYYDYDPYYYCPPSYYGSYFSLGFVFGGSYYHHHYDYPHYYGYGRPYYYGGRDRFYTYGGYRSYHSDSWRNSYASYRSRSDFRDGGDRRNSFAGGNSRYDYNRFNSAEVRRDRDARAGLDGARRGTNLAEGDYRYRTGSGVNNFARSGLSSARARDYEQDVRSRRAASSLDDVRRDYRPTGSSASSSSKWYDERARTSGSVRTERDASDAARRNEAADSAARRARADESSSRARAGESSSSARSQGRPSDAGEFRSSRGSSSDDNTPSRTSRGSSSPRDVGSSSPRESGAGSSSRSRAADAPSRGSSRSEAAPPSRSGGGSSRSEAAPARSGGSDGGSFRGGGGSSISPSPSRGSSGGGSASSGSSRGGGGGGGSSSSSGGGGGRRGR